MKRMFIKRMLLLISLLLINFTYAQDKNPVITVKTVNDGYGEFVYVPASEFKMGDNFNEGNPREKPVHTVYLDAYYIGKYEVTNEQFCLFLNEKGNREEEVFNWLEINSDECLIESDGELYRPKPGYSHHPVVMVTWNGAQAYCRWLTGKTGKTHRLPTEAEWEKAARGTDQRKFPWGNYIDSTYANYVKSGDPYESGNHPLTTPVGFYDGGTNRGFPTHSNASPYGAYDMSGNVMEWCADYYDIYYYYNCVKNNIVNNPKDPKTGGLRVICAAAAGDLHSPYRQHALLFPQLSQHPSS